MAKKAASKKGKRKKPGRTIADSKRRFKYDAGGRQPLSEFPLCPITVAITATTKQALKKTSDLFIDPGKIKPYGIAAVARVLMQIHIEAVDSAPREELVKFFRQTKGTPGRSGFRDEYERVQLLIPKHLVDLINNRVLELNDPEVGTATVIRWLLVKGLEETSHYQLYEHIPRADTEMMEKENLTVDALIERFQARDEA